MAEQFFPEKYVPMFVKYIFKTEGTTKFKFGDCTSFLAKLKSITKEKKIDTEFYSSYLDSYIYNWISQIENKMFQVNWRYLRLTENALKELPQSYIDILNELIESELKNKTLEQLKDIQAKGHAEIEVLKAKEYSKYKKIEKIIEDYSNDNQEQQ